MLFYIDKGCFVYGTFNSECRVRNGKIYIVSPKLNDIIPYQEPQNAKMTTRISSVRDIHAIR